jgi:hypothetical protein
MFESDSNKSELHLWTDYEYIKFMEHLQPLNSESFVFPSAVQKCKDKNVQNFILLAFFVCFCNLFYLVMLSQLVSNSWDKVMYGLDDWGLVSGRAGFFSSPQHPDQLWGPPNLLFS